VIIKVSRVTRSISIFRASAVAMIVALVLFPAVTRLAQIGVPPNPAQFSGVHRSAEVPPSPELVVPEDSGRLVSPEAADHPADRPSVGDETTTTTVLDTSGLRAPPTALV